MTVCFISFSGFLEYDQFQFQPSPVINYKIKYYNKISSLKGTVISSKTLELLKKIINTHPQS